MVNREARANAATLIRQFLASKVSNFRFADEFPRDPSDPALRAIELRLWLFYDDVTEEYCQFPVGSPMEALWRRCALFLDSAYEYKWETLGHHNYAHPIIGVLSGDLFRLGAIAKRKRMGHYSVWPFLHRADFDAAKEASGQQEIKADDDFPEISLRKIGVVIGSTIAVLQTAAFFGAVFIGIYSMFGHSNQTVTAVLCFVVYLLLLAIGIVAESVLQLKPPKFGVAR